MIAEARLKLSDLKSELSRWEEPGEIREEDLSTGQDSTRNFGANSQDKFRRIFLRTVCNRAGPI